MTTDSRIHRILDLARWAPSGDNTQPWRFEIKGARHIALHCFDTREHCVYDLDGHPSQIAMGALLETTSIAASEHGWAMTAQRRPDAPEKHPVFDLHFNDTAQIQADPLLQCIETRSVQRRPMQTKPLTIAQRNSLETAVGTQFQVLWLESFEQRLRTAKLMFHSAKIRLTSPEAYQVHIDIIDWKQQFSATKVPDQALGSDPITTKLMQFVMVKWERVEFFNRFLAGTWAPRIQLDFLPGLACAAHFAIHAKQAPQTIDDYVAGGRAMQRFWLTATHLGLQLQPEITPLVFSRYAREGRTFSKIEGLQTMAGLVQQRLSKLITPKIAESTLFMGRIGSGHTPKARSLRRPLEELLKN